MAESPAQVEEASRKLIGQKMYTNQTGPEGSPIKAVSICEQMHILEEFYIAFMHDRQSSTGLEILVSTAGGSNIEDNAAKSMIRIPLPVERELNNEMAMKIVDTLGIDKVHGEYGLERADSIEQIKNMYKAFISMDATMLEVNPWALVRSMDTDYSELYMSIIDTKITIDESALVRQPEIRAYRQLIETKMGIQKTREDLAAEKGINYVEIKGGGNIGCMVNGAGLAMATMDLITHKSGQAANFMDISGQVDIEAINFGL